MDLYIGHEERFGIDRIDKRDIEPPSINKVSLVYPVVCTQWPFLEKWGRPLSPPSRHNATFISDSPKQNFYFLIKPNFVRNIPL